MASREAALKRASDVVTSTPVPIWLRLVRHHLRLLAPSSAIWIIGLVVMPLIVVGVWIDTFPTQEERIALAQSIEGNPAFEAMFGRAIALETIEGFAMWRAGGPLFPAIVIWGVLAGTRLARSDEDRGHDELLLGGVLSRRALLASTLAALAIIIAIFAVLTALLMPVVSEMSVAGSWRFSLAMSGGFTFFATLGVLLAQLVPNRPTAVRIGLAIIGVAFAIRILSVLDAMPGWLPWATPFGWFAETGTPEIGSDVPLALFAGGTVIFAVAASMLSSRREIHGSLLLGDKEAAGPAPPYDSLWLHEVRQTSSSIIGFAMVGAFLAALFGMVAHEFSIFIQDFPAFAQVLAQFGLDRPEDPSAFIGLIIMMYVIVVVLYAAGHVASIRNDEATGRLTVLLTLPLSRFRWLFVNTIVGIAGIVLISFVIAFSAMVGTAITGTMLDPWDAFRAGLNLIPISVLFLGLGILLFGVLPRGTGPAVYTLLLVSYLIVLLDGFLDLPGFVVSLSPFDHLALVPGQAANLTASAVFLLIGIIGGVVGAITFRQRDMMMD